MPDREPVPQVEENPGSRFEPDPIPEEDDIDEYPAMDADLGAYEPSEPGMVDAPAAATGDQDSQAATPSAASPSDANMGLLMQETPVERLLRLSSEEYERAAQARAARGCNTNLHGLATCRAKSIYSWQRISLNC